MVRVAIVGGVDRSSAIRTRSSTVDGREPTIAPVGGRTTIEQSRFYSTTVVVAHAEAIGRHARDAVARVVRAKRF
jgi:hypothetical protein